MCIPNTKPPGEEMKSRVFLVMGVVWVGALPAVVLTVLNLLIVCRLVMLNRPGNSSLRAQTETANKKDGTMKVKLFLSAQAFVLNSFQPVGARMTVKLSIKASH